MAFGKFGRYHPDGVDVHTTLFDLIGLLRRDIDEIAATTGASHHVTFESNVDTCPVETDRDHVRYVVVNLLQNAVKYSEPGTVISLELTAIDDDVRVRIQDQGIGIPPAEIEALFSPFYRASNVAGRPGTGMGLAIAKKSAHLIGGRLDVRSEIGEGTTLTVVLPRGPQR